MAPGGAYIHWRRITASLARTSLVTLVLSALMVGVNGIGAAAGSDSFGTKGENRVAESEDGLDAQAPESRYSYWWYLRNDTGDSVFGEWTVQEGSYFSSIGFSKESPMVHGREASTQQVYMLFNNSYWSGNICYRGTWRNFDRAEYNGASNFKLVTRQGDQLFVEFSDNDAYKTRHLGDTRNSC